MKCYKNIPVTSPFNSFAHERFGGSFTFGIILMGWCKKDVTPLLTHWSYIFLALTHRYYNYWYLEHFHLNCPLVNIDGLVQEIHNSIANALELRLSCTNLLIWQWCHYLNGLGYNELNLSLIWCLLATCWIISSLQNLHKLKCWPSNKFITVYVRYHDSYLYPCTWWRYNMKIHYWPFVMWIYLTKGH